MHAEFAEPFAARAYTDTGPIIERVAAKYAGLGWLAKNTLPDQSAARLLAFSRRDRHHARILRRAWRAGATAARRSLRHCTRCLDACPTQAFPEPYVLDARRCISYLTIELRGAIPEELAPQMGRAVIGCDICQDVCPWNRKAPITSAGRISAAQYRIEDGKSLARQSSSGSLHFRSRNSARFFAAAP